MISNQIQNLEPKELVQAKAKKIAKISDTRKRTLKHNKVKIHEINEIAGGVEVYIQAWDKNDNQKGFGDDGTVDVERIRIFNPPVLVRDPSGDIVLLDEDVDGNPRETRYREDPKAALLEVLDDTVRMVGKPGDNIKPGKRGKTTSILYPNAGNGTAPSDNSMRNDATNATWTSMVGDTTADSMRNSTTDIALGRAHTTTDRYQRIDRGAAGFDTSVVGSDTISSAVLSNYVITNDTSLGSVNINVVSFSPADGGTFAVGDYDAFGTTKFSTVAQSSISTSTYNDFTLNASGVSHINTSGNTYFGWRVEPDTDDDDTQWTWSSNALSYIEWRSADQTGTSEDVKLTITHGASATPTISTHLSDSLVSVWLSDGSGLTGDLHGTNTATNNGATLSTGLNGDAATFVSADSDYINTNYAPDLGDSTFSMSMWVKTSTTSDARIFGSVAEKGANDPICQVGVNAVTTGDAFFQSRETNNVNITVNDDANAVNDGSSWHHIVAVRDTTANLVYIYVDGNTAVTSSDTRTGNFSFSSYPFFIGATNLRGTAATHIDAEIHQVAFWTRALSSSDVATLYNSGNGIRYEAVTFTPKAIWFS